MEERKCSKCKQDKLLSEFSDKGKDRKQTFCKTCQSLYHKEYYQKRKQYYLEKNKRLKEEIRKKYLEFLKTQKCADCPESDPIVLEADHLRDKSFTISKRLHSTYSWETIEKELEKCEIVCANCHRKRTYRRNGSYRLEE